MIAASSSSLGKCNSTSNIDNSALALSFLENAFLINVEGLGFPPSISQFFSNSSKSQCSSCADSNIPRANSHWPPLNIANTFSAFAFFSALLNPSPILPALVFFPAADFSALTALPPTSTYPLPIFSLINFSISALAFSGVAKFFVPISPKVTFRVSPFTSTSQNLFEVLSTNSNLRMGVSPKDGVKHVYRTTNLHKKR